MTGRMLQRYRLLEEVGHGGMAVVYRGVDASLERDVAVKLLHPHLAARAEHRRRLHREAKAVARLHHPNILEIYDFSGEDSPEAYIVTELIRGRTLKAFAQEHPFDPPELAAAATWVLAGALAHAHAQNIVHRDLKPENVMIREDGPSPVLKLMDFGIAQIVDRDDRMTVTGSLIGSPAHMAPEIIDGEEADARSDLFSLGTILYALACGQLPFEANSPGALLKKIVEGDYPDPRELRPAVSEGLARVIRRLLARREERFQSARELQDELGKLLADAGLPKADELVAAFVTKPAETTRETRRLVVERLMADAAQAAQARKTAKALAAYARVIAIAPGTGEAGAARQAIDRLKSRVRWRHRAAVALGLGAVGAIAFAVWPEPAQVPEKTPEKPVTTMSAAEPSVAWVPREDVHEEHPERVATLVPQKTGPKVRLEPVKPAKLVPVASAVEPPPVASPAQVDIQVKPYARIAVDGALLATAPSWTGELSPGPHRIELTHDCCAPLVLEATLQAGERREWREKLVPRDGALSLRVRGPPDAGIMVDEAFRAYLSELQGAPVTIPMERDVAGQWRYDRAVRVRLFAKGYRDRVETVPVRAGQTVPLDVALEPLGP